MTNVKRWMSMKDGSEWVELEDHARIVARLQREKAKLFVRCLELEAEIRTSAIEGGSLCDWSKPIESWDDCEKRLVRLFLS